jgi:hypothetical protein
MKYSLVFSLILAHNGKERSIGLAPNLPTSQVEPLGPWGLSTLSSLVAPMVPSCPAPVHPTTWLHDSSTMRVSKSWVRGYSSISIPKSLTLIDWWCTHLVCGAIAASQCLGYACMVDGGSTAKRLEVTAEQRPTRHRGKQSKVNFLTWE